MKNLIQLVQIFYQNVWQFTSFLFSLILQRYYGPVHISIFFISNHFDHHSVGINLITSQPWDIFMHWVDKSVKPFCHSVGIKEFFCQSDFTWNQSWRFYLESQAFHLTHIEAMNCDFLHFLKAEVFQMAVCFTNSTLSKILRTKNLSDRLILKFSYCVLRRQYFKVSSWNIWDPCQESLSSQKSQIVRWSFWLFWPFEQRPP